MLSILILTTSLIFAKIYNDISNVPIESCSAQVGSIKGTVLIKDQMENYVPFAWATITITSLDSLLSMNTSSSNAGIFWATGLPNGDYNVSVWAPHPTKTDWYWFDSTIVSVYNGDSLADFYLDSDEHLVPEFSDYAIQIVFVFAMLSSLLLIKRMKRRINISKANPRMSPI